MFFTKIFSAQFNFLWSLFVHISSSNAWMVAYSTELDQSRVSYSEERLTSFRQIWLETFLWGFISLFLVHVLATIIAFATLRKHPYGRFTGTCVLVYGTVSSLFITAVTSAIVAYLLKNSGFNLRLVHVRLCGLSQCALYLFFSSSTLMATL